MLELENYKNEIDKNLIWSENYSYLKFIKEDIFKGNYISSERYDYIRRKVCEDCHVYDGKMYDQLREYVYEQFDLLLNKYKEEKKEREENPIKVKRKFHITITPDFPGALLLYIIAMIVAALAKEAIGFWILITIIFFIWYVKNVNKYK